MHYLYLVYDLARPSQWVKNSFVFIPLFFSGELFCPLRCLIASVVFFCFCFAASGVYCLNDICDAKADRQHPEKRFRPVAFGSIPEWQAAIWMVVFFAAAVGCTLFSVPEILPIVLLYILLNVAYSLGLKRVAIVDVFLIALGFVLRVVAGGVAIGVPLSQWIVMITFLLALFLALAKRRDDVLLFEETGIAMRQNTVRLNRTFLDVSIVIVATVLMVCYIMYTVSDAVIRRLGTEYLYATGLFVLLGILRYLQLTLVDKKSGNPTRVLLGDRFLQLSILGWLLAFGFILYY